MIFRHALRLLRAADAAIAAFTRHTRYADTPFFIRHSMLMLIAAFRRQIFAIDAAMLHFLMLITLTLMPPLMLRFSLSACYY